MLATAWHQTDPHHSLTMLTLGINTRTPERDVRWGPMWTLSVCGVVRVHVLSRWLGEGSWGATCFFSDRVSPESAPSFFQFLRKHTCACTHTYTHAHLLLYYLLTDYDCLSIIPREHYFSQHPQFTTILWSPIRHIVLLNHFQCQQATTMSLGVFLTSEILVLITAAQSVK